ncbi:MAG: hypothetical protein K5842_04585 [Bacteroidales bacterium]|nr:hypothetical protein [Bacteroidales bacterium]
MKKQFLLLCIAVAAISLISCNSSMRRDVKRLTHKTEQCFSMVNGDTLDEGMRDEFNSCYEELESLMDKYDKKYKEATKSNEFSQLYIEEIRKSNMSDEVKNMFEQIYAINL